MIRLRSAGYAATVNPRGGGLAALSHVDVDVVQPQDGTGGPPSFRGAVLAPWSNRIGDGRYRFDGSEYRLPVTEPERGNALHGLVLDAAWHRIREESDSVSLGLRLEPSPGYPFTLGLTLTYTLSPAGLAVELSATNLGDAVAPYGCGFHPYVSPGGDRVDTAVLGLAAAERLRTEPHRLLPAGREPVPGTEYDFGAGRPLGTLALDDAFTGLAQDAEGVHRVRIGHVEGWCDASLPWVHLFTPPDRGAVAFEPCTAPPDAFRTGDDLSRLAPGTTHSARWGLRRRS